MNLASVEDVLSSGVSIAEGRLLRRLGKGAVALRAFRRGGNQITIVGFLGLLTTFSDELTNLLLEFRKLVLVGGEFLFFIRGKVLFVKSVDEELRGSIRSLKDKY